MNNMKLYDTVTNDWRKWFAWYPVELQTWEVVWLETIYRKWFHENKIPVNPSSWVVYNRKENLIFKK